MIDWRGTRYKEQMRDFALICCARMEWVSSDCFTDWVALHHTVKVQGSTTEELGRSDSAWDRYTLLVQVLA